MSVLISYRNLLSVCPSNFFSTFWSFFFMVFATVFGMELHMAFHVSLSCSQDYFFSPKELCEVKI